MSSQASQKFTPVNADHNNAIDVTGFVLGFERAINPEEAASLRSLELKLKDDLPAFSTVAKISVTIQQGIDSEPQVISNANSNPPQGVRLEKFGADGKTDWLLHIGEDKLIINCHDYLRWDNTWGYVKKFLVEIFKLIDRPTNKINFFGLQVIDKFNYHSEEYSLSDIFDPDSVYLTKHSVNAGKLWHVYQGWFEDFELTYPNKNLNIINIASAESPSGLFVNIDHNQQINLTEKLIGFDKSIDDTIEKIHNIFVEMHARNKNVVRCLFNETTRNLINLDG